MKPKTQELVQQRIWPDKSHAVAEQWLHAAQAPVRPRAATRSTHTLCSAALCVESVAECPSPALASPSASAARQHQPSPTAASIRRGSLALWPRMCGNRAKAPRDVAPRTLTTATFCDHLMGVFGWLYPVEHPRILFF